MTTSRKTTWLVATILLAVTVFDGSVQAGPIGAGTLEFRGSGDFDHERLRADGEFAGSITEAAVDLGVAVATTDLVMVGGSVLFDYLSFDPESGSSVSTSSFRLAGDLIVNVPTEGRTVPFLHASVGFIHWSLSGGADLEMSLVLPFVGGGFRVLVGEHAAFNVAAGFAYHSNPFGEPDTSSHNFTVRFGLSAFPKGLEQ